MVLRLSHYQEIEPLEYSNPKIPEGINTSKSHPLNEFLWLTSGIAAVLGLLAVLLILLADFLTSYIPFHFEQKYTNSSFETFTSEGPLIDYVQTLTKAIVLAEKLPPEMNITVHYIDNDTVNAFATLGGHVFLFRGLLEKLPNENALAMLLAHEIAHIKHRHPITSLGRGIMISLGLAIISGASADSVGDSFLGETGFLTLMKYNRDMELEADKSAIGAVVANYGHLNGAGDLFTALQVKSAGLEIPEFFSSHPMTEQRISNIQKINDKYLSNKITPLPDNFKAWLEL